MKIIDMWRQRRRRNELYSTADYWDSKAAHLEGAAVSMWPNNHLNALYEAEQLEVLDRALGPVAGRDVLDIGCGTGRISRHLAGRGARVTGFDFAAAAVDIARREPGPPVTYRVQSIFDLDEVRAYDAAVAWGTVTVACRDAGELGDALRRIRAALRPGGQAVLLEPIHDSFLARVLRLDVPGFTRGMRESGFEVERVEELHFWPARFALAFFAVPRPLTRAGYAVGQSLMRLPPLRHQGDYKAIVARRTVTDIVPFNRVLAAGEELRRVREAIDGGHVSGSGPFSARAEEALSALTGSPRTLLTTSCTHALEMACHLLDLQPGDEVIVPSFTFVSTAAAVAMRGAVPVFADIRPDTLNLDERLLEQLRTDRTRAVFLVHYAGVGCEMEAIAAWAAEHGLAVVEDNAHGLFGSYRGRPLGSFGDLSTLSFHETKNVCCGEGGALQVNRPDLIARAEILREKGTNRSAFFRGQIDKYTWVDLGSSWVPSDLLAAFLWGQLERREDIQGKRHAVWDVYAERLAPWAAERGWRVLTPPDDREHPAHLFALLAPDGDARDRLIAHLRERDVQAVFHYIPLHSSPAGERLGRTPLPMPVTDRTSATLVRLPLWAGITDDMIDRVVAGVRSLPTTTPNAR